MASIAPIAKLSAQFVASIGVGKIVSGIVKNNVVVTTTVEKVVVGAGSLVLGSMLVEQTTQHIERVSNDLTSWFEKRNEKPEEITKAEE